MPPSLNVPVDSFKITNNQAAMTDSPVTLTESNALLLQAITELQRGQKELSEKLNSTLSSIVSAVENLKLQVDSQNSPMHQRTFSSSSLQSLSPAPTAPGTIDVNLDTIVADQPVDTPKKLQVVPISPSSSPGPLSAVPRKLYSSSPWGSRVILTTYPGQSNIDPFPLSWGHLDPLIRGPIVVSRQPSTLRKRNAIGAHGGSYSIYHSLAVAMGDLPVNHRPNFAFSEPPVQVGPFPQWGDPEKIVAMDPFGHMTTRLYSDYINKGIDIRPTIAITKAHMKLHEIEDAVKTGRLRIDGHVVLNKTGEIAVTKVAVEPVWFLPGVAKRFGIDEGTLRRALFEDTGGSYPELITRNDLKIFLPPIGGLTAYIFGPVERVSDPNVKLALRVHDECNGSDVFS
ncbi:Uracil-regulated protein 1, partial [Neolecta irregularis DAH-3]